MIEKRIAYYARKVSEYGATHISKNRNKYRADRLTRYKKMMHEGIEGNERKH